MCIVFALIITDYHSLNSKYNIGPFAGIISMIFNIVAMILSNRYEARHT